MEYFEFKLFHSNLVTIKEDWRDRFPQGHGPGEWSYIPSTRDMIPYLIDDVLTHYVLNPSHVKPATCYFWNRIPKKVYDELQCPEDKPFKVGWGLYLIEEFSQLYLMLLLVPVFVIGILLASWWCVRFRKSLADGATVVSGFAALVMEKAKRGTVICDQRALVLKERQSVQLSKGNSEISASDYM